MRGLARPGARQTPTQRSRHPLPGNTPFSDCFSGQVTCSREWARPRLERPLWQLAKPGTGKGSGHAEGGLRAEVDVGQRGRRRSLGTPVQVERAAAAPPGASPKGRALPGTVPWGPDSLGSTSSCRAVAPLSRGAPRRRAVKSLSGSLREGREHWNEAPSQAPLGWRNVSPGQVAPAGHRASRGPRCGRGEGSRTLSSLRWPERPQVWLERRGITEQIKGPSHPTRTTLGANGAGQPSPGQKLGW